MWRWIVIGIVSSAIAVTAVLFVVLRQELAVAGENGIYSNDCCGTITLADGEMLLNGRKAVKYAVARDTEGPYLLPRAYVGAAAGGFEIDGTRSVLKLRLDRLPGASTIVLFEGLVPYVFLRKAPARM